MALNVGPAAGEIVGLAVEAKVGRTVAGEAPEERFDQAPRRPPQRRAVGRVAEHSEKVPWPVL